ncbi:MULTISPECIES: hypothetical protein [Prochlorococcus]|uniref:hypothetical protein n=1 Tax=Prochlorococcus TaxID=1218 RepID=UPI00053383DA|nr:MULTISPECIES: hypothetical protein [Prochlorococcus]KGG12156.1 hypothetical protein EV05_1361 [Prochlorococcus sp. MIT 0601]
MAKNSRYISLESLDGCRLCIGNYPCFIYNATGGGGLASVSSSKDTNLKHLNFDVDEFSIPSLNWRTTKFLGLPLPPGLLIDMQMDKLEGMLNKHSGDISLNFEAKFFLKIWPNISFPALCVSTFLKTGVITSKFQKFYGSPLDHTQNATLVGVALIPVTNNTLLNLFLDLPNESLACLKCQFKEVS